MKKEKAQTEIRLLKINNTINRPKSYLKKNEDI